MADNLKSYDELDNKEKLYLMDMAARILSLTSPSSPKDAIDLLDRVESFSKEIYKRFPVPKGSTVLVPYR